MPHYNDYIKNLIKDYPEEAKRVFADVEKLLDEDRIFAAKFDTLVENYMVRQTLSMDQALDALPKIAQEYGINEYTLNFVYIMNCTEILKGRYEEAGIDEKVFYDSMDDLRCKLLECIECKGVPGTFVPGWNNGFLKMTRFAYGRFQFEVSIYSGETDFVTRCGKVIKNGDPYINFHIPSSGVPLTDEVRLASYKEAYRHYVSLFPDGKAVFGCGSWLLYPRHREFLPPHLNILRFMDDFEMVSWEEEAEGFHNDWRVFGRYAGKPYSELPRDTSLRRAYADWLSAGNKAGHGFGVFVFDGERII